MRWLTIDCLDPLRLAAFWATLLGVEEEDRIGDPVQYVLLRPPVPDGIPVQFQRVPEGKVGKTRQHLDLAVSDVEAATERIEALGGARAGGADYAESGFRWRVLLDPEGNEFCLLFGEPS